MRLPTSLGSLSQLIQLGLLLIGASNNGIDAALNGATLKRYELMSGMGLYPDGSAKDPAKTNAADLTPVKAPLPVQAEWVTLPIDHSGKFPGTYQNRFWVDDGLYKHGSPIFVLDVGEADASPYADYYLRDKTSFFHQMVAEYNGMGIVWEHRYYGASLPFNVSQNTPATEFKYLTIEQALADIPTFAWQFKRPKITNATITPAGTPWIMVGGSYSGIRSAFTREKYPETIFASYAASAPVQASVNMSFYYEPIYEGMVANGWGNCTNDIRTAVRAIDAIEARGNAKEISNLYQQFLGPGGANFTKEAFADDLVSIFGMWQSYGVEGQDGWSVRAFCDALSIDPATNKASPAGGWAAIKGVNYTLSRWANFTMANNLGGQGDPEGADPYPDGISWTWQYCTQWGFLQSANVGVHQLGSKYDSLSHVLSFCETQFPDGRASGLLPSIPRVNHTNSVFGGWHMRPSNVFWTGGEFDPWRTLSPLSSEPFSPLAVPSHTVPMCGNSSSSAPVSQDIFGYLLKDAEHCFDYYSDFPEGIAARALFNQALPEWLKCWTRSQKPKTFYPF